MQTIGVIGGSGLYDLPGLKDVREVRIRTPFGEPSDAYVVGELGEVRLIFLPRHGRGHRLLPSEINARANIWGFKNLGARRLLSFSAVGSMREEIAPGHMVIVDQYIDRTRARVSTFFGEGLVGHVPMADPFCADLSHILADSAREAGAQVHRQGTYLCIEGPQFSTRAESRLYRQWGVHVIGMTLLPEARLAREAELCFSAAALSTDYDCWHQVAEDVSAQAVVEVMRDNVWRARETIRLAAKRLAAEPTCNCSRSLAGALMTAPDTVSPRAMARLDLLAGHCFPRPSGKASGRRPEPKQPAKKKATEKATKKPRGSQAGQRRAKGPARR